MNTGERNIAATGRGSSAKGDGGRLGTPLVIRIVRRETSEKSTWLTSEARAGRVILRGARATASGFAIRFGARIAFLYVAARLFGVELFGAYALAVAAVELAVTVGGLGSKRILFKRLRGEGGPSGRAIVLDAAVLVAAVSLASAPCSCSPSPPRPRG